MPDLQSIISFRAGKDGTHSFFYLGEENRRNRTARVSMSTITKIKKALVHRQEIGLPVQNLAEFLSTYLPVEFLKQLNRTGTSMVEAWHFMDSQTPESISAPPKPKRQVSMERKQAENLARILARIQGGKRSPRELVSILMGLIKDHLPQALEILEFWASTCGYSPKGGYILVGNAKRDAKKAPSRAA